jgi:hypothetical protein
MPAATTQRTRKRLTAALVTICAGIGAGFALVAAANTADVPRSDDGIARTGHTNRSFAIRARPATHTVDPGATATYRVRIRRGLPISRAADGTPRYAIVRLRAVRERVPPGASASLEPKATRGRRSALIVTTAADTPPGTYRLAVKARRRAGEVAELGSARSKAFVKLVVAEPETRSFTISGTLPRLLAPGIAAPLDLVLTNPHPDDLAISNLRTELTAVDAPQADAAHPCTTDDFAVTQFSGSYGFEVASATTASLSDLGIPESLWPRVAMVDRPVNQDGCKGASLALGFTGTGTGGTS